MKTLLLILLLGTTVFTQQPPDNTQHESKFANVNGIKVHYLDFGGKGDVLIFLTGMGDTAHIYDEIAPAFVDGYRVIAITRRGFGESERPAAGYDVQTLTEDVRGLMDHLKINRAHFIGHSAGGNEISNFAALYPKRTLKIVYLDAAYDRAEVPQLEASDPLAPQKSTAEMSERQKFEQMFAKHLFEFKPAYKRIKSPALSFYAMFEQHWAIKPDTPADKREQAREFIEKVVQPYQQRNIELFRTEMPHGRVVVLRGTHHYFFRDARKKPGVLATIREFLEAR